MQYRNTSITKEEENEEKEERDATAGNPSSSGWPTMTFSASKPSSTIDSFGGDLASYLSSCKGGQIAFDAHTVNITSLLQRAHSLAVTAGKVLHASSSESLVAQEDAAIVLQTYSTYTCILKTGKRISKGWTYYNFFWYLSDRPPIMAAQKEYEVYGIGLPQQHTRMPLAKEKLPAQEVELLIIRELLEDGDEKAETFAKATSENGNGYSGLRANRLIYDELLKRIVSEAQHCVEGVVKLLPEKFYDNKNDAWKPNASEVYDVLQKSYEAFTALDRLRALVDGSKALPVHLTFLQAVHGLKSIRSRPPTRTGPSSTKLMADEIQVAADSKEGAAPGETDEAALEDSLEGSEVLYQSSM